VGSGVEDFTFSCFSFSIRAATPVYLPPYKGSTFRGGFGHAFRRACCTTARKDCADCLLKNTCVYSWVFETPVPADAQIMRKYPAAPHPFVLEPPNGGRRLYKVGERLDFRLILMGRAVDYLPYFIYSFHELGKLGIGKDRGKFFLDKVIHEPVSANTKAQGMVIYEDKGKTLIQPAAPTSWTEILEPDEQIPSDTVRISFLTPTRIKYKGRLTKDLEFHVLFRNLLRRISLLSYFHCDQRLDDSEFKDLINRAKEIRTVKQGLYWHDWQRWSNRQGTRMKLGGFLGEITYEGDLKPFWPYIRLGEYVHVGKGSSFGLGRYGVTSDDQKEVKHEASY